MEIYVLGSAAGIPTRNRHCTSIAIVSSGLLWLIDCGEPSSGQLFRAGLSPMQVDVVFISHFHADHVSGLLMLLQVCQLRHRKKTITIYGPDRPSERIWGVLNNMYLGPDDLPFRVEVVEVPTNCPSMIDLGALKVKSIPTFHSIPSVAYSLHVEGKKIFFSGDTTIKDGLAEFAFGSDLLILEAAHNALDDIGLFVKKVNPKILLINHIHPNLDEAEDEIKYKIRQHYKGKVIVAKDLRKVELK